MDYSDDEQDDIIKPTRFVSREYIKNNSSQNQSQNVIREGGEPKVAEYKNKSGRAINEAFFDDFELYDEHMKQTTKNLKEKYKALMKSNLDPSEGNGFTDEEENKHYQDDFEPVETEHKRNDYVNHDDDDEDMNNYTNELPNDGEDTMPDIPIIDTKGSVESREAMFTPKRTEKEIKQKERIKKNPNYENVVSFGKKNMKEKLSGSSLATDKQKSTIPKVPKKPNQNKSDNEDDRSTQKAIDGYNPNNYSFNIKRTPVELSPINKHNISADFPVQITSTKNAREYISNLIEYSKQYSKIDSARLDHSAVPESKERYAYLKAYRYSTPQRVELPRLISKLKGKSPDPRLRNKSEDNSFHLKRMDFYREANKYESGKNSSTTTKDISNINSGTNVSSIIDKDSEVIKSSRRINSFDRPMKKIRTLVSDYYFSERVEHLLNSQIKHKTEQEVVTQNTVLRRYINEMKEDLRRLLNKASNSTHSTRRVSPSKRISQINDEMMYNESLMEDYLKEIETLSKMVLKANAIEYMVKIDEKIELVKQKKRKIEIEKKQLEMLQKKEQYNVLGNNFLYPQIEKGKVDILNQRREVLDRMKRDSRRLKKLNKKAQELIHEQTEHLGEMAIRYKKLRVIAEHFGVILDPSKIEQAEKLQKKHKDLKRKIAILEKSIMQRQRLNELKAGTLKSEIIEERKYNKKLQQDLANLIKASEDVQFEVKDLEEVHQNIIYQEKMKEAALREDIDTGFRVTQNETSMMNVNSEKDDFEVTETFNGKRGSTVEEGDIPGPGEDIVEISDDDSKEGQGKKKVIKIRVAKKRKVIGPNGTEIEETYYTEEEIEVDEEEEAKRQILVDVCQVEKMTYDTKPEFEIVNGIANIQNLSDLFELDKKKEINKIYKNYSITEEYHLVQVPPFDMEYRPELAVTHNLYTEESHSPSSPKKKGHYERKVILSKQNSIDRSRVKDSLSATSDGNGDGHNMLPSEQSYYSPKGYDEEFEEVNEEDEEENSDGEQNASPSMNRTVSKRSDQFELEHSAIPQRKSQLDLAISNNAEPRESDLPEDKSYKIIDQGHIPSEKNSKITTHTSNMNSVSTQPFDNRTSANSSHPTLKNEIMSPRQKAPLKQQNINTISTLNEKTLEDNDIPSRQNTTKNNSIPDFAEQNETTSLQKFATKPFTIKKTHEYTKKTTEDLTTFETPKSVTMNINNQNNGQTIPKSQAPEGTDQQPTEQYNPTPEKKIEPKSENKFEVNLVNKTSIEDHPFSIKETDNQNQNHAPKGDDQRFKLDIPNKENKIESKPNQNEDDPFNFTLTHNPSTSRRPRVFRKDSVETTFLEEKIDNKSAQPKMSARTTKIVDPFDKVEDDFSNIDFSIKAKQLFKENTSEVELKQNPFSTKSIFDKNPNEKDDDFDLFSDKPNKKDTTSNLNGTAKFSLLNQSEDVNILNESNFNRNRNGMPRRLKIAQKGDQEIKKKELAMAEKVEKEGNNFFSDLGFD